MGKTLYLECYSGISGDMTVASLLDLGADEQGLLEVLKGLDVPGFDIKISRVKKSGLDCLDFDVILDHDHENHDHDMEYLYGHYNHSDHDSHHHHHHEGEEHSYDHHEHHHDHHHSEDGHHHEHTHEARGFFEIKSIIEKSSLTDSAKAIAIRVFEIVAHAEAKAHGKPFEEVHFHEVGAVDSIVDVIAAAYCIDNLGIDEVIVPYLCEGTGTVRCQHGILPVPVPAVTNIAMAHDLTLKMLDVTGELVTPTGAAFVAAVTTSKKLYDSFTIKSVGLGAGKRDYGLAGFVRALIIEEN